MQHYPSTCGRSGRISGGTAIARQVIQGLIGSSLNWASASILHTRRHMSMAPRLVDSRDMSYYAIGAILTCSAPRCLLTMNSCRVDALIWRNGSQNVCLQSGPQSGQRTALRTGCRFPRKIPFPQNFGCERIQAYLYKSKTLVSVTAKSPAQSRRLPLR